MILFISDHVELYDMQLLIVLFFHRYEEFHPFLFCQHANSRYVELESFNKVCIGFSQVCCVRLSVCLALQIRGIIAFSLCCPALMKLFHTLTSIPRLNHH